MTHIIEIVWERKKPNAATRKDRALKAAKAAQPPPSQYGSPELQQLILEKLIQPHTQPALCGLFHAHPQEASMANTAIRRNTSALQLNEILVALSGLRMTADQASDVVRGLAGCIKGDDYERFGSVDLGDVAQTMQDEIEAFEEPGHCTACNGCGEGQHPGTRCGTCRGRGELPSPREIEKHNMEIAA